MMEDVEVKGQRNQSVWMLNKNKISSWNKHSGYK